MDFSQNFYGVRAMNSEFFEGDSCRLNFGVSVVLSVSTLWSPAILMGRAASRARCSKVVLDLALAQSISKPIETQNIGRATPLVIAGNCPKHREDFPMICRVLGHFQPCLKTPWTCIRSSRLESSGWHPWEANQCYMLASVNMGMDQYLL